MRGQKENWERVRRDGVTPAIVSKRKRDELREMPLSDKVVPLQTEEEAAAMAAGTACETLVIRSLQREDRPWWIHGVRHARLREDQSGIDVVVHTSDLGRLFLQVKRSRKSAKSWAHRHEDDERPIGIVVVKEWESEEVALGRSLGALILLREKILGERCEPDPEDRQGAKTPRTDPENPDNHRDTEAQRSEKQK